MARSTGRWETGPKDWIDGIHAEEGGADNYGMCPQLGAEVTEDAMYGLICKNSLWKAWDDLTNVGLNAEDVKTARALVMEYVG